MNLINNKYKIIENLGAGCFGEIYKGQNIRTQELVAIKVEPISNNLKLLKNESVVYQYLVGTTGVPNVKWFGKDAVNYYMVLNLLGDSLQILLNSKKSFSLKLVLQIGLQIISILQSIHDKGLVHRDIKPDNFLLGKNDNERNKKQIYIIDFGFCKSIANINNKKKTTGLIGSLTYASLNAHNYTELSYNDDLESLGYMLIYFYQGFLEWQKIEDVKLIIQMKKGVVNNEKIPIVLRDFLHLCTNKEFKETPDYNSLITLLKREIETIQNLENYNKSL
jgi:serine/threonine protein kinase